MDNVNSEDVQLPSFSSPGTSVSVGEVSNNEKQRKTDTTIKKSNSPISFKLDQSPLLKLNPTIKNNNLQSSTSPSFSNILVRSFQPKLRQSNSSDSGEQFKDIQSLLAKYRKESLLLSDIHMMASEYCRCRNQFCTLTALIVSLVCSVVDPILQKYADDVQKIFTTISFAFIGGLNVVFNFLAFQQREEKHKQARDSYLQIVDSIEVALAYSHEEGADKKYDFNKVMGEVRQIRTSIVKNAPAIPVYLSHKYEDILAPSLLKYELKVAQKANRSQSRDTDIQSTERTI